MPIFIPKPAIFLLFLILCQAYCQRPPQNDYCPNLCTGPKNGECSAKLERCLCNPRYFGADCSQIAPSISESSSQTLLVLPKSQIDLYFYIDCFIKDINFEFEASQKTLDYHMFLEHKNYVSDQLTHINSNLENPSLTSQTMIISSEMLEKFEGGLLRIEIQNSDAQQTVSLTIANNWSLGDFSASIDNSTQHLCWGLLIIIFIMAWVTVARILGWRFMEDEHGVVIFTRKALEDKIKILTKQDLDKNFPIKSYTEINVAYDQTSCSICLLDYNTQDPCRHLNCEHIFHNQCIEDWLAKNNSCPICKLEISPKVEV